MPVLRAAALSAAGKLAAAEGRHRASAELVERGLAIYRQLGEPDAVAKAVGRLAGSWYMAGDVERSEDLLRTSEIEARETGNRRLLAALLRHQAALTAEAEDPQRA